MSTFIPVPALAVAMFLALATGCTTMKESYHGHPPTHVWAAMKSVAESPQYDDWHVTANNVWVDEEQSRIEIHRRVDRLLRRPHAKPLREEREWRFQVSLTPQDPPTATFVSRGIGVPMHAHREGERYLMDVWKMLGGAPVPQRSTPLLYPYPEEGVPDDTPGEDVPAESPADAAAPEAIEPVGIEVLEPDRR